MRLVIDTIVRVSGVLWKGRPWDLLRLAEAGAIALCMAPAMTGELARVLAYGKRRPRLDQLSLSAGDVLAYAIDLASFFEIPQVDPACHRASRPRR